MIELYSTEELLRLPPPSWLIDGVIEKNSISTIYGPSGSGKSFVGLDWALCIATGTPWHGRKVAQAPVIYIAAEGGRSIAKRVRAWMDHYQQRDLTPASFAIKPLYVRDQDELDDLQDTLEDLDLWPGLLVIDTLSQSFGTGDENSMDMQEFVGALVEMRNDRYMAVMVIHHTNAAGSRERGHSSFRAGMDHMFQTTAGKDEDFRLLDVTLTNDKQKDSETIERIDLVPKFYRQSLVLVDASPIVKNPKSVFSDVVTDPSYPSDYARAKYLAEQLGVSFATCKSRIIRWRKHNS